MILTARDRWIIGIAATLCVAVPILSLWPQQLELHEQPVITATPLSPVSLALTGAATTDPLFNPDRSPSPPASDADPAAPAALSPPILAGIAMGHGGAIVLLKTAAGETVKASVGDDIDGWRVVAIAHDHATVEQAGHRADLSFDFANTSEAPQPSSGTPAPSATPPDTPSMLSSGRPLR